MNLITIKWPGINRKRWIAKKGSMVIGIATLALFCGVGIVLGTIVVTTFHRPLPHRPRPSLP